MTSTMPSLAEIARMAADKGDNGLAMTALGLLGFQLDQLGRLLMVRRAVAMGLINDGEERYAAVLSSD